MRLLQKPLKEWNHKDTKFLPGLLKLHPADKKVFLCAFVSLWFKAFMLFATLSFELVAKGTVILYRVIAEFVVVS